MEKYSKWIEIDADAVHENYQAVRAKLTQDVTLMAVVKNNAYGHGLVETARLLAAEGVKNWAVTWVEEDRTVNFRSALELFVLIESTLCH